MLDLEEAAKQHMFMPAVEMKSLGEDAMPYLEAGKGIYVTDADGRELIDGPAGMWCTQVGYGRKEIAQAMYDQAMNLSYSSPWFMSNEPSIRLAEKIASFTPGDLNRIFFTTGGSTAVDTALRFVEFRNNVRGLPEKKKIVVRRDGYHGSTDLTAAVSGRTGGAANFDIAREKIHFLSSPDARLHPEKSEAELLEFLVAEFEDFIAREGADTIAVFLAEPVLASGGIIVPPKGYHARFKAVCEANDIVYISDEVVTGFGRCGEWFASEKVFGVVPDIITFAKGLTSGYVPLGGLAISDKLIEDVSGDNANGAKFTNGYTYTGHPVSCAAALANIEIFEKEGLLEHVRKTAPYFQKALQGLSNLPLVYDVRGAGLVGCVECRVDNEVREINDMDRKIGARIDELAFEKGLIVRPVAAMCVMSPPLIMTEAQIDDLIAILREAIIQTGEEFADGKLA